MKASLAVKTGTLLAALLPGLLLADNGQDTESADSEQETEEQGGPPMSRDREGWTVTVGAAGMVMPNYTGARNYQNRALPWLDIRYGNNIQFSAIQGLRYTAIRQGGLEAGPYLHYQGGRRDRGAIRDFDNVSGGAVAGGFLQYRLALLQFSLDVGNAFTGDISGTRVQAGMTVNGFIGRSVLFGVGPRVTWYSQNWNQGQFGVSNSDAAAAGIDSYDTGRGFSEFSLNTRFTWLISENLNLTTFMAYRRVTNDAADSPIVDELGDPNQGLFGVVLGYTF